MSMVCSLIAIDGNSYKNIVELMKLFFADEGSGSGEVEPEIDYSDLIKSDYNLLKGAGYTYSKEGAGKYRHCTY